jgi:hypothetical protein
MESKKAPRPPVEEVCGAFFDSSFGVERQPAVK